MTGIGTAVGSHGTWRSYYYFPTVRPLAPMS